MVIRKMVKLIGHFFGIGTRNTEFNRWYYRWQTVNEKMWKRFYTMDKTEESMQWLERNVSRMNDLLENKSRQLTSWWLF